LDRPPCEEGGKASGGGALPAEEATREQAREADEQHQHRQSGAEQHRAGVPEPRLGEQVVAYVTTRAGQPFPGFEALIEQLRGSRIAPQKYPVAITGVEAMPTTATGKVQKAELARLWRRRNWT